MGKNIVLCFDGTGDWVASHSTNVAKAYIASEKSDRQLCYYDGGVGTLTDTKALGTFRRTFLRLLDSATATGLHDKVLQGYDFLVDHYEPGDKIFLFGFSRGAYTARVLAGLVHEYGLLAAELKHLSPYLWQSYANWNNVEAGRVKRVLRLTQNVKIDFLGVFDTVSSVGVLKRFITFPHTAYNESILRVCHAVSIDEQRNVFPEDLFKPTQPGLTEVWFPGVHRDVGGGLSKDKSRIADEAMEWIFGQAREAGLIATDPLPFKKSDAPPVRNIGLFNIFVFAGFYPLKQFSKRVSGYRFNWPSWKHIRTIPEEALIHPIARLAYGDKTPRNWPMSPCWFDTPRVQSEAVPYRVKRVPLSLGDLVGTSFATALLISFWNASVGAPFGSSWPFEGALPIWIAVALTLAFLLFQGLSQSLEMRLKPPARKIFDLVPSLVGLALVPLLIRSFFPLALLAGVGLWVLGQVPNRSVLRSVRLLPYPLIIGSLSATAFNLPTNWFSPLLVQITLYMAGLVFMVTSIAGRWRAAVPLAAVVGLLIAFILRSEISTELLSVAPTLWSAVMIAFCVLKDRLWFMRRSTTTELAPR